MKRTLTHRGWFGVCPVYLGDLHTDCPIVLERSRLFVPLMVFSETMYGLVMACVEFMGGEPPGFPLRITAPLDPQREVDIPDYVER